MRAVAYSTRQIIRLATVLAATASLLLALAAPFMGTAHAELDEDSFIIFTNVQDGHANEGEKSEPITFRVDSSDSRTTGGDLFLDTFPYTNDTNKLHISCSSSLVGVTAVTTEGHPWGAGVQVEIASLSDYYIFRHHVAEQGNNHCGEGTLPGGDDDEQNPDPVVTTLTLIKVVQGGDATIAAFSPTVAFGEGEDEGTLEFDFSSEDDPTSIDVEPNKYTLGEQDYDGYDLAGIDCGDKGATVEGATTIDVTIHEGDEVICTFTNVASTTDEIIVVIEDEDDEEEELVEVEDLLEEVTEAPEDVAVLDDVAVADEEAAAVDEEAAAVDEDVAVLDEVATADELPATGLETIHLALLAALFAALGVLFLLGTETDKVRAYRA